MRPVSINRGLMRVQQVYVRYATDAKSAGHSRSESIGAGSNNKLVRMDGDLQAKVAAPLCATMSLVI
jgi:hypothetical protein